MRALFGNQLEKQHEHEDAENHFQSRNYSATNRLLSDLEGVEVLKRQQISMETHDTQQGFLGISGGKAGDEGGRAEGAGWRGAEAFEGGDPL